MSKRSLLVSLVLSLPSVAPALAAEPVPLPPDEKPLQTRPIKVDDSQILQGWTANILGIGGDGKTSLVVNGQPGYLATATIDGVATAKANPAVFELADKDHRIALSVKDDRGSEWSETVDVPKGMKVTVEIKARYEHRGFEGQIKNDTLGCRVKAKRRHLKFEIWLNGAIVGNPILLEPGKSAPGVRLKPEHYELRIFEKKGADYVSYRTAKLNPTEPQWRFDEGCN